MPQYELMYLLGSHVADTEVPKISGQILKFVEDFGGTDIRESQLGKKKLAYPIKKTRNGFYVVVNFSMDSGKINQLDAKIRTQDSTIIRYLIVNLEEHLKRAEKDKAVQAKIVRKGPPPAQAAAPEPKKEKAVPKIDLSGEEDIDKKIDEALSEDITK
ncbi:MAG: 30S ribosomal protein S6 [Patescibacteria group bacterium]|nr:30S ribosomal protein S6 [Patescibacteria group bacterium]